MMRDVDPRWLQVLARQSLYMAEPPAGQVRHTVDPPSLHTEIRASSVTTTVIALLAVGLRLFTRTHTSRGRLLVDDYLLMLSMIFSFILLGLNFKFCELGLGLHFWDVLVSNWSPHMLRFETASTMTYSLSLVFSKLSLLALYLQLSPERGFRIVVWILIGITSCYAISYQLISVLLCHPVRANWDLTLMTDPNTKCIDKLLSYILLSCCNIIMDVAILLLPIRIVLPLQVPKRQKVSIFLIFATGAFVCGVAIKRTLLLTPLLHSPDYTWDAIEQFHWCFAEVNAGIVCASVPALKPFFVRYLPSFLNARLTGPSGSGRGSGSSGSSGTPRFRRRKSGATAAPTPASAYIFGKGSSSSSGGGFGTDTIVEANKKRRLEKESGGSDHTLTEAYELGSPLPDDDDDDKNNNNNNNSSATASHDGSGRETKKVPPITNLGSGGDWSDDEIRLFGPSSGNGSGSISFTAAAGDSEQEGSWYQRSSSDEESQMQQPQHQRNFHQIQRPSQTHHYRHHATRIVISSPGVEGGRFGSGGQPEGWRRTRIDEARSNGSGGSGSGFRCDSPRSSLLVSGGGGSGSGSGSGGGGEYAANPPSSSGRGVQVTRETRVTYG